MQKKVQMITVDDFHDKYFNHLKPGDYLLDVRTEDEYDAGHIPGAKNQTHEAVIEVMDELKKHKRIFIYCRRGMRAQVAAKTLSDNNCEAELVCLFDAGMDYWTSKGWPVE